MARRPVAAAALLAAALACCLSHTAAQTWLKAADLPTTASSNPAGEVVGK